MNLLRSSSVRALLTALLVGGGAISLSFSAETGSKAVSPVKPVDLNQTPPESENGYLKLDFDRLASFVFVAPAFDDAAAGEGKPAPGLGDEQIPATIKKWHGKKAVITGYMMPVKMEKGLVTEFLVMRNTMACCYGGVPNLNEWVTVKMKKGGVPVMVDVPVTFYGDFKVGVLMENGYLTSIYQLDCERMGEVKS